MFSSHFSAHFARPKLYSVDAFAQQLFTQCGAFKIESSKCQSIKGQLNTFISDSLDIAVVGSSVDKITRNNPQIKLDHANHFFILMQCYGSAGIHHLGQDFKLSTGDILVVDSAKPIEINYTCEYSLQLSIQISRDEFCCRFGKRYLGGVLFRHNENLSKAMFLTLQECLSRKENIQGLGDTYLSILGSAFLSVTTSSETYGREQALADLHQKALHIMGAHYKDYQFTVDRLAQRLGVSLRQLQRCFKPYGCTPHKQLQHLRIKSAQIAITNMNQENLSSTIASIAYENGFNDLSTFYRQYKKTFDQPPALNQSKASNSPTLQ